jgi:hypothetical protein
MCGATYVFKGSFGALASWLKEVEKTCAVPHGFIKAPLRYLKGSSKNLCDVAQVF